MSQPVVRGVRDEVCAAPQRPVSRHAPAASIPRGLQAGAATAARRPEREKGRASEPPARSSPPECAHTSTAAQQGRSLCAAWLGGAARTSREASESRSASFAALRAGAKARLRDCRRVAGPAEHASSGRRCGPLTQSAVASGAITVTSTPRHAQAWLQRKHAADHDLGTEGKRNDILVEQSSYIALAFYCTPNQSPCRLVAGTTPPPTIGEPQRLGCLAPPRGSGCSELVFGMVRAAHFAAEPAFLAPTVRDDLPRPLR